MLAAHLQVDCLGSRVAACRLLRLNHPDAPRREQLHGRAALGPWRPDLTLCMAPKTIVFERFAACHLPGRSGLDMALCTAITSPTERKGTRRQL